MASKDELHSSIPALFVTRPVIVSFFPAGVPAFQRFDQWTHQNVDSQFSSEETIEVF